VREEDFPSVFFFLLGKLFQGEIGTGKMKEGKEEEQVIDDMSA